MNHREKSQGSHENTITLMSVWYLAGADFFTTKKNDFNLENLQDLAGLIEYFITKW